MKLIKPSYKILAQGPGLQGIYEQIELAGRTCYASSHKIQYQENETCDGQFSTTAKDFVDRMIASKHYAMLEHGTVYLTIRGVIKPFVGPSNFGKYLDNPYSKVVFGEGTTFYITTNYRVLVENGWLNDLQYLCEPTEFHEKRVTVKFTTSNGIMREFTRHRSHSFAVESTRYCNYSKEKFDHQVTFVIPSWANLKEGTVDYFMNGKPMWDTLRYTDGTVIKDNYSEIEMELLYSLKISENMYFNMITHQAKPQEAREVLPLATKCDMVMTGFVSDWNYFFDLRARGTTGAPHPDAKALAEPLMGEFYKRGYIK